MKYIISVIFIVFAGCAGSPLMTGLESDQNRMNMTDLEIGMTERQVSNIMGQPYKIEPMVIDNDQYSVWYYITEPVGLAQSRYISENFTPLIFKERILKGWGYQYYNYLLDIDNAKNKLQEAKRQKYTDDPDEWPPNRKHAIIDMQEKKKDEKVPDLQKTLESITEEPAEERPKQDETISPKEEEKIQEALKEFEEKEKVKNPQKQKTDPLQEKDVLPQCKDQDKEHPNYHWLD